MQSFMKKQRALIFSFLHLSAPAFFTRVNAHSLILQTLYFQMFLHESISFGIIRDSLRQSLF